MEKFNFDRDWLFHLGDVEDTGPVGHTKCYMASKAGGALGPASPDYDFSAWQKVNLPHDWAVYGQFDEQYGPSAGYKPRGKGWYVKRFRLEEQDKGKQILLEFDGISTHAAVYCNGSVVARNFCGYTSFTADITDMALYGEQVNTVSVFVDADAIEGWWYEGAGIYRHTYLYKKEPVHIQHWGVFVSPEKKSADVWDTKIEVTVENSAYISAEAHTVVTVRNAAGTVVGHAETNAAVPAGSSSTLQLSVLTYSPALWDIDEPNLYTAECAVSVGGEETDRTETEFGYRTISLSADEGFFLNGRRVQIYGTCNHQDHAGVGVAVPDAVNEYRIKLLKEMGSNAYRCAHGNPSPEILTYCDRHGMLVMDENRNFNTSAEGLEQVRNMVLRDRNHPSVVMYSLFNEEPFQGTPTGRKLAERMACEVRKLDDTRFLTGAMNTGVTEDGGCADLLDVTGFNYITHTFDSFREKFPKQPMIGSENNSAFQTRGVYQTDNEAHIIDSYDSVAAPWGNTHRDGFRQIDMRPHIMGMFIWTGFDYRGEPTPYEWGSIGTQFGIMDTCGFKKDAFYLNQAFFTTEPMIHMLPHWNWKEGQKIKVMVHTNCEEAELFINEQSKGRKAVDRYDMAEWEVIFTQGTAKMVGYRKGKAVCEDYRKTAGEPVKVVLETDRKTAYADCRDAVIVNVHTEDREGTIVPCAANHIRFFVRGGTVIGVGNGDPNSHEEDKACERNLFNGYCQAIIEAEDGAAQIRITAESDGIASDEVIIALTEKTDCLPDIASVSEIYINTWREAAELAQTRPDPNIKIEDHDMNTWEIICAGSRDGKFTQSAGYALYKTTCVLGRNENGYILKFYEVTGEQVEIFVDGENCFTGQCPYGRTIDIPMKAQKEADIAVIIYNGKRGAAGGITKCVVLAEK